MKIFIGADHRGYGLKEEIKKLLAKEGLDVVDIGNDHLDPEDDYPDVAFAVAKKISESPEENRGIVICGSGVGVDIVANKLSGVRSALITIPEQAFASRSDDNANVLALGADYTSPEKALKIVDIWLKTPFSNAERHQRRIKKISIIEAGIGMR